jgi:4-hydroxybenzoate polyprenyltransferase
MPDMYTMGLFAAGAIIMRGAGCTINDYWDREIDSRVERTRHRPIASGEVSPNKALIFFGSQLAAGLVVLVQFPVSVIALGATVVPLVVVYPLAKRFTSWPQLVLGLTFNWGALLGGAAVLPGGAVAWAWALPLYGGAVCWTLVYDTLYAHQDKRDDKKLGLHSSALTLGDAGTKPALALFSAVAVGGVATAGCVAGLSWPFYLGTGLGSAKDIDGVRWVFDQTDSPVV